MGKLCNKLVVYLDQNFISEMAKGPTNVRVNPQFTAVYELLHQGFTDEKLVVPMSPFHDLETSLAANLKERFQNYQGYLGQIRLRLRDEIEATAIHRAISLYQGQQPPALDYRVAFTKDPDRRLEEFTVRVNMGYGDLGIADDRRKTLAGLELARQAALASGRPYPDQVQRELDAHARNLIELHPWVLRRFTDSDSLVAFVRSRHFRDVPTISIFARMWSKLFIDFPTRPLRVSDDADIKLISAYLPYVDVLATDTFMTTLIRDLKLDTEYGTSVFAANKRGLADFESYLTQFLPTAKPVRWPELSVFVLSDDAIKQDSWEFFRTLGNHARSCERGDNSGWVELFAFDDGHMPQYQDPRIGGAAWSYYGLQDVTNIPFPHGATRDDLLRLCRERSRAHKFVLIDKRIGLPPGFMRELLDACRSGRSEAAGLTIHETAAP